MKQLRYRLHWANGEAPKPALKWAIYDWKLICPIAYAETRVAGRKIAAFLNHEAAQAADALDPHVQVLER